MLDLFILAAEPSGDLHGANLIQELLQLRPDLKIGAISGPKMRKLPIHSFFPMENLQVMGFIDVLFALPKIAKEFFAIRKTILSLNPKAVVCIDYPGFNLRLERSLRKKGYQGKLIHYICPTVWAWGKKRIPKMAKTLDLLLTIFPFEKECFASTKLNVHYVGHPLACKAALHLQKDEKLLALFPGSRETEIRRNFPMQLKAAKKLKTLDPSLKIGVSIAHKNFEELIHSMIDSEVTIYPNSELMQKAKGAIATSGTITLELALHNVPTVVNYAIRPIDCFIAQKIFHINIPFYCIVNIILSKEVFPELFGPNLSEDTLQSQIQKLWFDPTDAKKGCQELRELLGAQNANLEAARAILTLAF